MAEEHTIISRAEAKAKGLTRYFTGLACPRGHISERKVVNCACPICSNENKRANRASDLDAAHERDRKWREANRESFAASQKKFRDKNREIMRDKDRARREKLSVDGPLREAYLARRKELRRKNHKHRLEVDAKWRRANPDKCNENASRYYYKNREQEILRAKRWKQENRDKVREYSTGWFKKWRSDPNNRDKEREYHRRYYLEKPNKSAAIHRRRALKKSSNGTHTAADLVRILKAQKFRCVYCRADLRKEKKSLDHIVALARGGSNDKTNLQYTCVPCNGRKHAKDPIAFAREIGRLL